MTIAESLRQEGRIEGLQEGRIEGLQEGQIITAKNLYSMGFKADVIRTATGLSFEILKQVLPQEPW